MNAEQASVRSERAGYTAAMTSASPRTFTLLRSGDYRRMRWKNGAGWTSEILRVPDAEDWHWRLSIADVEADARFSAFPGVERELVLLEGNGIRLVFDDGARHALLPPHDGLRFNGERPLAGELIDGPSRDFNLMWRRDDVDAQLWRRPLVGAMVIFVAPGETWAVHMLAGQAQISGEGGAGVIQRGDTAIFRDDGTRTRFALDGAGEALLIRIAAKGEI